MNGNPQLSTQLIFDRGAWNLTATSKAFSYVFNTTDEYQMIAQVLSGWGASENVHVSDLSVFDTNSLSKTSRVQALMFSTCSNLNDSRFNVDQRVLDYFAAHLIRHYPQFKLINASAPAVKRLGECGITAECQLADIMIWSMKLNEVEHVEERNRNNLSNESD